MLISPASGCSNPAIRRRHVVFPEPEGPSIEKNSPARMSRSRPSTALTEPKWRSTPEKRTAQPFADATGCTATVSCGRVCTDMRFAPKDDSLGLLGFKGGAQVPEHPRVRMSASAENSDVICHPAIIGHATLRLSRAFRDRRAPELDLLEIAHAVDLAAFGAEKLVVLTGSGNGGYGAEPGGEVALHL